MGTIVYACGCSFSHSMFGDHKPMGFYICQKHMWHPKVLELVSASEHKPDQEALHKVIRRLNEEETK